VQWARPDRRVAGRAPVVGTFTAHYQNGDAITGAFSTSASCEGSAIDAYLNSNPTCP
jgi:hypothetical protein